MFEKPKSEVGFYFYLFTSDIKNLIIVDDALFDFFGYVFCEAFDYALTSVEFDVKLIEVAWYFMNGNVGFLVFLDVA